MTTRTLGPSELVSNGTQVEPVQYWSIQQEHWSFIRVTPLLRRCHYQANYHFPKNVPVSCQGGPRVIQQGGLLGGGCLFLTEVLNDKIIHHRDLCHPRFQESCKGWASFRCWGARVTTVDPSLLEGLSMVHLCTESQQTVTGNEDAELGQVPSATLTGRELRAPQTGLWRLRTLTKRKSFI